MEILIKHQKIIVYSGSLIRKISQVRIFSRLSCYYLYSRLYSWILYIRDYLLGILYIQNHLCEFNIQRRVYLIRKYFQDGIFTWEISPNRDFLFGFFLLTRDDKFHAATVILFLI